MEDKCLPFLKGMQLVRDVLTKGLSLESNILEMFSDHDLYCSFGW